jgi:hypothetical protein
MSVKGKRHIHKYYRADVLGEKIWACALPLCSHHMPPHYNNLIPGKASLCWECGEAMILDSDNMKMDKPTCVDCRGINELNQFTNKTA